MDLTEYVRKVSREDFGWEFRHEAVWNSRLQTTGGRFFPKDRHLDFNPKMYEAVDLETFRKIVRHELCHYHLYDQKRGYQHGDTDFRQLLAKVDGLRYAPRTGKEGARYLYACSNCGQVYPRKRRIDLKKYHCGRCRSPLVLKNQS
ncbi:SprT family protein [Streptococcus caprae]|uniref:SprT family protein n=1 Tax=Streptococcus caprae TaxID=1640501 RepID=A0ABV8CX20_9STRE